MFHSHPKKKAGICISVDAGLLLLHGSFPGIAPTPSVHHFYTILAWGLINLHRVSYSLKTAEPLWCNAFVDLYEVAWIYEIRLANHDSQFHRSKSPLLLFSTEYCIIFREKAQEADAASAPCFRTVRFLIYICRPAPAAWAAFRLAAALAAKPPPDALGVLLVTCTGCRRSSRTGHRDPYSSCRQTGCCPGSVPDPGRRPAGRRARRPRSAPP